MSIASGAKKTSSNLWRPNWIWQMTEMQVVSSDCDYSI